MLRSPQRIDYAKSKSYATLRKEDPNFVPPTSVHANALAQAQQNGKRPHDGDYADAEPSAKREKADESDEEMEIEDDDDSAPQSKPLSTSPHIFKPACPSRAVLQKRKTRPLALPNCCAQICQRRSRKTCFRCYFNSQHPIVSFFS